MPRSVERIWSRLSRMSWDELRTRLRQEAGKRIDAAFYRASDTPELGERTGQPVSGEFFFAAGDLDERIRLLRQHLPHEMDACLPEADDICRHVFRLLGYIGLQYGEQIDWHLDAVHGKRAPLIPAHQIDFLNFNVIGDHKITWELNRHQHLVTLAKAWLITRDEKYAAEAIGQWYSWQSANPYPLGVNWSSSLEVAFRSLSWLWMRQLLAGSPTLSFKFEKDMQRALALNARHIERYLSTYFSPNTHLLGEAVALFFIGTMCPQVARAKEWKQSGWKILQREAQRQILPDGMYFEHSLYYHVYAVDFFLHARALASRNGMEIPPAFDATIGRMLGVLRSLEQTGPPDGFGDDDGGRVFNPRRNRAKHMTDPIALGKSSYGDEGIGASSPLTEEAIWLFGADAISKRVESNKTAPRSLCLPDSGLYFSVSSNPPQQIVLDAGPRRGGRGGHAHAGALSVRFSFNHRFAMASVDAGTYVYTSPNRDRDIFRGTRAHNTLSVDELDQSEPDGPFAWKAMPNVQIESWVPAATFTFFAGTHSGYERLPQPVQHRRFVFHLHDDFWLVRDVANGVGSHRLETSWHFASDVEAVPSGNTFVASPLPEGGITPDRSRLILLPLKDASWKCDLARGYVSPTYGVKVPTRVLRCSANVSTPAEHAMLLVPKLEVTAASGAFLRNVEPNPERHAPAAIYNYDNSPTIHYMIFGPQDHTPWTHGLWASDARFLYFAVRERRITHLIGCEASFVRLRGEPLFSSEAPLQYLEWLNRKGERWAHSSDETAAQSISVKAIEELI